MIVFFKNEKRFDSQKFFGESIIEESKIDFIRVSSQVRQKVPYTLKKRILILQDFMTFNFDSLTAYVDENLF